MYISKSRFINWTRCPMYFPLDLKYNPTGKGDIDDERERREEMLAELKDGISSSDDSVESEEDEESFDVTPGPELESLLPYYHRVEDEALKVAQKYFSGTFVADSWDVHKQKLFEYEYHGHTYRCYVDIYNENDDEINIIEVKATTNRKYRHSLDKKGADVGLFFSDKRGGTRYDLFVKNDNFWHIDYTNCTVTAYANTDFEKKKAMLLDRYAAVGKYPHDLAFQRFVIERALRKAGDNRPVKFYLAVLNSEYVFDGARDAKGNCIYNEVNGQEIVTFLDMNEITAAYQPRILEEIGRLESYIATPCDIRVKTPVGKWCAWGSNTECVFWKHCFQTLRGVPDYNSANKYLYSHKSFLGQGIEGKYELIEAGKYHLLDIEEGWLKSENQKIQRECCVNHEEYVDKEKMNYWLGKLDYPIYHFDFEAFPCPLPRFRGETPYRQSVFEFSLHIEHESGVCDKIRDNYIFLNLENYDDEREALAKAIVDYFAFDEDGKLIGTMLAQNTSYEKTRLTELADLFPQYGKKLLAICDKSADLIHLLKTNEAFYSADDAPDSVKKRAKVINYYHEDLGGSYSIKKTLPVLVPSLTYSSMDVGNGVQAYITYLNYDSSEPTFDAMKNKDERRAALKTYCQQDTWAMVEILRAVRTKIAIP